MKTIINSQGLAVRSNYAPEPEKSLPFPIFTTADTVAEEDEGQDEYPEYGGGPDQDVEPAPPPLDLDALIEETHQLLRERRLREEAAEREPQPAAPWACPLCHRNVSAIGPRLACVNNACENYNVLYSPAEWAQLVEEYIRNNPPTP